VCTDENKRENILQLIIFILNLNRIFFLLLGITVLPFSGTLEILQGRWLFGRTFCHIWLAIDVLYCTASIYGLMFISIERYVGVTRPLRYPIIITHRRTLYAIFFAWIVAAFVSIAPFLGWRKQVKSTDSICEVNDDLSYVLFSCSFSFYIPLIIILCVYGRIYGEANRQYQFLTGGQKKVHLKQLVGQESVTLRVHLPKHLSASLVPNGHALQPASNGNKMAPPMTSTSSNKFSRLKRERKAGKDNHKKNKREETVFFAFYFSENIGNCCWNVYPMLVAIFSSITN
jgi:hypothetical protein